MEGEAELTAGNVAAKNAEAPIALQVAGFGAMYFAQGYPLGFLMIVFPLACDAAGITSSIIGLGMGMAMLPLLAKPLIAPAIDRFSTRTLWLRCAQAGMMLSSVLYWLLALTGIPVWTVCFLAVATFACFCAVQDTATDGIAITIVPASRTGLVNAVMGAGIMVGATAGGSLGSWFVAKDLTGFAFVTVAIVEAVAFFASWAIGNPRLERRSGVGYFRTLAATFRNRAVRRAIALTLVIGATGWSSGFLPLFVEGRPKPATRRRLKPSHL